MALCGAEEIYTLGGVQALAAMAFGAHAPPPRRAGLTGRVWGREARSRSSFNGLCRRLCGPEDVTACDRSANSQIPERRLTASKRGSSHGEPRFSAKLPLTYVQ